MQQEFRLPPSILGGDPFNQFRFLYRLELLWKLFDEDYCLSVMRSCYEAGGMAYDLSFEENTRLFKRLLKETGAPLIGFGNPTWKQGVLLEGKHLYCVRDRIIRTLVERFWPRKIAKQVEESLSNEAVLVFGYDRDAELLSDKEIESISLDENVFKARLSIFEDCRYIFMGGSDADYLVSLGRMDVVADMAKVVRELGFSPMLLTQFPSLVVPAAEDAGLDVDGYVVPLNKSWSWFSRDECVEAVKNVDKSVIAFMPLSSGELKKDVRGALDWLFGEVGVESILFGTATARHARETTMIAQVSRDAVS